MTYLSRDQILSADDRPTREVEVPEWGGSVLIRALSAKERDEYEASLPVFRNGQPAGVDLANIRAKLVAHAIVDENGALVFSQRDVAALGEKNAAALDRIFDAVRELSGMTDDEIEAIEGNSAAALGGSSSSDSPATSEA